MIKTMLSEDTVKLILGLYQAHTPINGIVIQTGILRRVVERTIKENGLVLKTKSDIILDVIPQLKDAEYLSNLYHNQNLSLDDIAFLLKTNQQVVKNAFKRLGLKVISGNLKRIHRHAPQLLQDYNTMYQLYITEQRSVSSLALDYNVSETSIKTLLKLHNIPTRSHSEQIKTQVRPEEKKISSKIGKNLRSRLSIAMKNNQKTGSAVRDLGCTVDEFKIYLESKFEPGMSWDNYGYRGWHIDHIQPLDSFNLADYEQLKIACHYTNLQPMWASANFIKSNKINVLNKVNLYIVCGPAGSGKSYVCEHLHDKISYLSYDKTPKEEHIYHMVNLAAENKDILYDPFRKPITISNRYKDVFNIHLYVISETEDVIRSRILERGGSPDTKAIQIAIKRLNRWAKKAVFVGTSSEVLEALKQKIV